MSTLVQIARELGVSTSTVSYVLAGKSQEKRISDELATRVIDTARRLKYKPNSAARSLLTKETRHIGLLIRNAADRPFDNPPVLDFLVGINLTLEEAGYVGTLVRIGDVQAKGQSQSRVFDEHMLDGLVVIGDMPDFIRDRIEQISPMCVWLDNWMFGEQRCLRRDEFHAGQLVGQKVLAGGYRKVTYIGHRTGSHHHYSSFERYEGLLSETTNAGIKVDVDPCSKVLTPLFREMLEKTMKPDTALVAADSFAAMRLGTAAATMGLKPGVDFGLVSCDSWEMINVSWPELSRVEFDRLALGKEAARMLLKCLANPNAECKSTRMVSPWQPGNTLREKP